LPNEPPPPSEPPSGRRAASTAPLDSAAGRPGRPGLDGQEASGRGDSDDDSTVAPLPSAHTRLGPSPSLPRVAARPPQAAVSPLSGTAVAKAAAAAAADEQLVFEIAVDGGRRVRVANPDLERIRELQRSTGLGTITTDGGRPRARPCARISPRNATHSRAAAELNALYERYTSGAGMDQLAFTACLQGVATHRKLTLPRQAQLRTQADALFRWLDRDSDGELSRQEFVAGLAVLCAGSKDAKLFTLFRLADADADGYVTPAELATLLRTLYRGIVAGVDAGESARAWRGSACARER
jgi:Ca2+-binding EF-hand superfamily protein